MKVAQSCSNLCDPLDCSPPGSSVQGILQARILEWVAILSSPGNLSDLGIKPRYPAQDSKRRPLPSRANSLSAEKKKDDYPTDLSTNCTLQI